MAIDDYEEWPAFVDHLQPLLTHSRIEVGGVPVVGKTKSSARGKSAASSIAEPSLTLDLLASVTTSTDIADFLLLTHVHNTFF